MSTDIMGPEATAWRPAGVHRDPARHAPACGMGERRAAAGNARSPHSPRIRIDMPNKTQYRAVNPVALHRYDSTIRGLTGPHFSIGCAAFYGEHRIGTLQRHKRHSGY